MDGWKNNSEKSFISKVSENIPSAFSMSTIYSSRSIKNEHGLYRRKDCLKKFCEFLREHAMKIINFDRKIWSYKQTSSKNCMKIQKSVTFVKKNLKIIIWKIKKMS